MTIYPSSCQLDHSSIKYVTERAPVCEQSATWGETCGPGPVHSASYYSHGCRHIQPLVSKIYEENTRNSQRSEISSEVNILANLHCGQQFDY